MSSQGEHINKVWETAVRLKAGSDEPKALQEARLVLEADVYALTENGEIDIFGAREIVAENLLKELNVV